MKKITVAVLIAIIFVSCKKSTWIISKDDNSKFIQGTYNLVEDGNEDVFKNNGKTKIIDFGDSCVIALFDVDNEIIRSGFEKKVLVFVTTNNKNEVFKDIPINEEGYLIFNSLNYLKVKRMIEDANRVSFTYEFRGRVIGARFYLKE